jgi:hypothetical protein
MQNDALAHAQSPRQSDPMRSMAAALALACDWLQLGNLAEAAKWAAIAASLGEAENRTKSE